MKKILTKTIAIILSISLSTQSLYAAVDFWEAFDIGQLHDSTTGFQQFRGANGESVFNIGGSLTIKRNTQDFPLWWKFQPPSIKASCSGISFKGLFGSIINLDEIATQFEEAGASFAWGILVGIIYSLPGIGAIFTKLDAWAKKIQSMLANSCKAGIGFGKMIGGGVTEAADGLFAKYTPQMISDKAEMLQDKAKLVSTALDCNDMVWANIGSSVNCEDEKPFVESKIAGSYLSSPSFLVSTLLTYYSETKEWPSAVAKGEFGTIAWDNVTFHSQNLPREISFVALINSVVGDMVVSQSEVKPLIDIVEQMSDESKSSKQKEELIRKAEQAMRSIRASVSVSSGTLSMNEVVKYLITGNSMGMTPLSDSNASAAAGSVLSKKIANAIRLPTIAYYAQKDANGKLGNLSALAYSDYYSNSDDNKKISSKITDYILDYKGVAILASEVKKCYLDDNNDSCVLAKNSLVDDDSIRYFAKVYRNSLGADRKGLGESYEAYVQYQMAYAIYYKIVEYTSILSRNLKENTPIDISPSAVKNVQSINTPNGEVKEQIIKNINDFKKLYLKELKENYFDKNIDVIIRKFKEQNIQNMKRAYGEGA